MTSASPKQFPFAEVALVIVLSVVVGSAYVFRDQIIKVVRHEPQPAHDASSQRPGQIVAPPPNDPNWTLLLAGMNTPDTLAAGRIRGEHFVAERVTLQGGTLNLRQSTSSPPDLGVTIYLFASRSENLAGQTIQIEATRTNSPRVTLRWKNDQDQPATKSFRKGYALRLEFGRASAECLPGKIYLCTPDEAKSYVTGTFTAEIRKPSHVKPSISQTKANH